MPGDGALFGEAELRELVKPGQTAALLERAVAAARSSRQLEDVHDALIGAARAGAYALDQALTGGGPKVAYAVAAVLTPYREVLEALGFAPERAGDQPVAGAAAAFLAGLAVPTFEPPPPTP